MFRKPSRQDTTAHGLGQILVCLVFCVLLTAACRPTPGKPALPATQGQAQPATAAVPRPTLAVTGMPGATLTPAVLPTSTPFLIVQPTPAANEFPTLADLWDDRAHFAVDVPDTGLPMGESDTVRMGNGEFWSYLHASSRSTGVVDQCGAPVDFPGCTVIYRSSDDGLHFSPTDPPVCQITCVQCPCTSQKDHVNQQQYPRVFFDGTRLWMVYEYLGRVMLRHSPDGLTWSLPEQVAESTVWHLWFRDCPAEERIGDHPFVPFDYACLRGGPPGLLAADDTLYVFMAQGQNPGAMGCFRRSLDAPDGTPFEACAHNPLFVGAAQYGPADVNGTGANGYFDFRTISSAELLPLGAGAATRYYMFYEGVRGPGPGAGGDSQFGLGLARSLTDQVDGPWEKFPGNPILVDLPGNIGIGHADVVVANGRTYLYTSLDGVTRSRLVLTWKSTR